MNAVDPARIDIDGRTGLATTVTESSAVGQFVTEKFDYDGGRQVTVYVPPRRPDSVVFAGDGESIARWGTVLEQADLDTTMIVGVHGANDETTRLHEYSPSFDPPRFDAHTTFFVDKVPRWIDERFGVAVPRDRAAICGASASGELALALGLRYPDRFGAVLCASPGAGYRPPSPLPNHLPRTYLVAGTSEPFFLDNAQRWATVLTDAGAEVVMATRDGAHGDPFWQNEFPLMAAWAFGTGPARRDVASSHL